MIYAFSKTIVLAQVRTLTRAIHLLIIFCLCFCGPPKEYPTISAEGTKERKHGADDSHLGVRPRPAQNGDSLKKSLPLLKWTDPIDSEKFGFPPDAKINGKSLSQVLTSQQTGRDDGQLCSSCHNRREALGGYGMDVDKNAELPTLSQWDAVGTVTQIPWAGAGGWATKFIANQTKPEVLKTVMKSWLQNNSK